MIQFVSRIAQWRRFLFIFTHFFSVFSTRCLCFSLNRLRLKNYEFQRFSLISYHFSHDYYFWKCFLSSKWKEQSFIPIQTIKDNSNNNPCRLLVNTLNDFNFKSLVFLSLPLFMQTLNSITVYTDGLYSTFYRRSPKSRAFFAVNNSALYTASANDKNLYWFWKPKLLWITVWGKQWSFSKKSTEILCLWSNSRSIKCILLCSILCFQSVNCRRILINKNLIDSLFCIVIQLTSHL